MSNSQDLAVGRESDARQIPESARRYAQNRTLPFLVFMALFCFFFLAIGGLSLLAGQAYRDGNMVLFWVCVSGLIALGGGLLYFSVPPWGGRLVERLGQRLYGGEGTAELTARRKSPPSKWLGFAVGAGFGGCVLASVLLGLFGYIPLELMQPVSALYLVPFLVFLFLWMRPVIGPLALLWPILYGLHALLVVAGAPIQFGGSWQALNMMVPTVGYGVLSGLISHLYSRVLLRRLMRLSRVKPESEADRHVNEI